MQVNEENQVQIQRDVLPSLNDIISPKAEINPNQGTYQNSSTTETFQPEEQIKTSYVTTTKTYGVNGIAEEEEMPQETTEIKEIYKKEGGENTKYEQTVKIQEEPDSTTKIVKRVIQTEQPTTETSYYEKKVIKTITSTTTRGGQLPLTQNTRYVNTTTTTTTNSNTNNVVRSNGNRGGIATTSTYTRPTQISTTTTRGATDKNSYLRNYDSARNPSSSQTNNRYGVQNSSYSNNSYSQSRNNQKPQTQKRVISSQSYAGNNYQQKKPDTSTYNRQARSPEANEKRKTIYRGNPIKNIQITHIICSSKPQDFHITENLNTESLKTEPIEISKADRVKLKKSGKSSWTTSVQDNIKPIVTNLKGKTTIFQHARGIGMTNEKKENINPMFYTSEIKKLEPIIKEKEKEKVEYMTFRNSGAQNTNITSNKANTSRNNYNRGINYNQQQKNYSNNNNSYNSGNNRGSKITSTVRTNQTYTRGNYSGRGNDGEIVKETKTKVQMGSRSQFRNSGNPTSSVTIEKRVYNSNNFFNK